MSFHHPDNLPIGNQNHQFRPVSTAVPSFQEVSTFTMYDILAKARHDKKQYFFGDNTNISDATQLILHSPSDLCKSIPNTELILEGLGELPHQCSEVRFCGEKLCLAVPVASMKLAFIFPRREAASWSNSDLPGLCDVVNERFRRYVVENTDTKEEASGFGLLKFNLPGYRYCGPGNYTNLHTSKT